MRSRPARACSSASPARSSSSAQRPGDAATFKIVKNLLAGANLAAGAEALALAQRAGIDPVRALEVINASSGASWIVADRMARELAGDHGVRAAAKILAKDVGIAASLAQRLGAPDAFARTARDAFRARRRRGLRRRGRRRAPALLQRGPTSMNIQTCDRIGCGT